MTTTAQVPLRDSSAPSGAPEADLRCAACDHRVIGHDAIGLRYCQATQSQALARKCICLEA